MGGLCRSWDDRGDIPSGVPDVADSDRILQALGNLVSNALKFTPRHGLIAVSVFDRFFQARKGDLRGVGLGLPITQGIVEAYGGRIWLESAVGVGSTFYFSIPAVPYATLMVGRPGMLPRLTASFRTNVSGTRKELNTCSTQSITSGAASSVLRLLGSPRRASA